MYFLNLVKEDVHASLTVAFLVAQIERFSKPCEALHPTLPLPLGLRAWTSALLQLVLLFPDVPVQLLLLPLYLPFLLYQPLLAPQQLLVASLQCLPLPTRVGLLVPVPCAFVVAREVIFTGQGSCPGVQVPLASLKHRPLFSGLLF